MTTPSDLTELARLIRYYILVSTTSAGSGHATSSLSAVELTVQLFFRYFRFDLDEPQNLANDRFILSKGHASPLLYSLYAAAGSVKEEELLSLRKFGSRLEGHPTRKFPFTEVPTGALGQGLSVGVGMCLALRQQLTDPAPRFPPKSTTREPLFGYPSTPVKQANSFVRSPARVTRQLPNIFVLIGDGEMAEGQVWEAVQLAAYYKLNNLMAILDVNRLGQSQQTMLGANLQAYARRVAGFGWRTYVVEDGHDLGLIDKAYSLALEQSQTSVMPAMIIAKTLKGKGISIFEDKNGWHGVPLPQEKLAEALAELGEVDKSLRGVIKKPELNFIPASYVIPAQAGISSANAINVNRFPVQPGMTTEVNFSAYKLGDKIATRKAYGSGLVRLGRKYLDVVALDADVKNSTYSELFKKDYPERFFDMFIAEQNMVSVAAGLAKLGYRPFVSTFGCFLMRAADQIRMAQYSGLHIVFCGSHAGVSIGEDGPSQMGLEDMSLFRTLLNSIVLHPSDAVSTERLVEEAYAASGLVYIRTARSATPVIYDDNEVFPIGKSKILRSTANDRVTLVAAGITVFEALKASDELKQIGIAVRVIDCYSVKPIDKETLSKAAQETGVLVTIEDHYRQGGLGDAVLEALALEKTPIHKLAVFKEPISGKADELLDYAGISTSAIVKKVKEIIK